MADHPPSSTGPALQALASGAGSMLADLAGIALDLDDPRTQRVVDEALQVACERAESWTEPWG